MKINNLKSKISRWALALSILGSFAACSTDEGSGDWVDPRYRVEDSYTVYSSAADGVMSFSFEIQSDMEWEVYSDNPEWCVISPSSGVADQLTEVTVTYNQYYELDDREDVINLKSDYWVFKQVPVTQIGVAKLYANLDSDLVTKANGSSSFTLFVNQDWSLSVAQSSDNWLDLGNSATSGTGDGSQLNQVSIAYTASDNSGEKRVATISIFDRNDVEMATVIVTQEGLELETELVTNIYESQATSVTIPITATVEWDVYLASDGVSWLTDLEKGADGESITFNLGNNGGSSRAAYVLLQSNPTTADEPQINKFITILQASNSSRSDTPTYDLGTETPSSNSSNYSVTWYSYVGTDPATVKNTAAADGEGYWNFNVTGRQMTSGTNSKPQYGLWEVNIGDIENADESGSSSNNFFLTVQFDGSSTNVVHFCICQGNFWANYVVNGVTTTKSFSIADNFPEFDYAARNFLGLSVHQGDAGYLDYAWYLNGELFYEVAGTSWTNDYWYDLNVSNSGAAIRNIVFGVNAGDAPVTAKVYDIYYTAPTEYDATPTIGSAYEDTFNSAN